jgi:hypothetical protein
VPPGRDWTVSDVLPRLPAPPGDPLPPPLYFGLPADERPRVGLATEEGRRHMTDESWQLFAGLGHAGYVLAGHGLDYGETDVPSVLEDVRPGVVVVQDPREWEGRTAERKGIGPATFRRVESLRERADVFVATVVKDAHQQPDYHRRWCAAMGAHAFVCYYHPDIVCRLTGYVRRGHVVRTYHTVDATAVPVYSPEGRAGCLLSGATGWAYPLRQRLLARRHLLPETDVLEHPGYRARGCATPEYLRTLSRYRVAICTASRFGYALRKLIEAVACGCVCVTDLPADDVLPEIDGALVRVRHDATVPEVAEVIRRELAAYDADRAEHYARLALAYYDYRAAGLRLAADIEAMRRRYPC